MESEKIIFPAFQIAEMYRNYLVDLPELSIKKHEKEPNDNVVTPAIAGDKAADITFMGGNRKNVLVLVDQAKEEFIAKNDLIFLANILKACQLSIDDIAIVNIARQKGSFADVQKSVSPKTVLLFGINPQKMTFPVNIPDLQVARNEGVIFIKAPELVEMNSQSALAKALKTKLWLTLKEAFGV